MKITFLPMNLIASGAEWPRYISTFFDVITNQCLICTMYINQVTDIIDDIINYHVWLMIFFRWVSTSLPNFVISSVRYANRGTAWKTQISVKEWFFSKKKSLVKSLIFWWNSLNWLSLCKMKDCCFHEFCVKFYVVCNVTKF